MSSAERAEPRFDVAALYVPGDQPRRIDKALGLDCQVFVDLEDGVPPDRKEIARRDLRAALAGVDTDRVHVRVSAARTTDFPADCEALAGIGEHIAVRLPKVEGPADIDRLLARLGQRSVSVIVETARGMKAIDDIAAHPAVVSVSLGEADLRASLGIEAEAGLDWLRSALVVSAAAAGLPSPMMSAYTALQDPDGLLRSCRHGRELGMWGRTAIHPSQLDIIRDAFSPDQEQVAWAAGLLNRAAAGQMTGTTAEGEYFDAPVLERASMILRRARATGRGDSSAAGRGDAA